MSNAIIAAAFQKLYASVNPINCTTQERVLEIQQYLYVHIDKWISDQPEDVKHAYRQAREQVFRNCLEIKEKAREAFAVAKALDEIPVPPPPGAAQ